MDVSEVEGITTIFWDILYMAFYCMLCESPWTKFLLIRFHINELKFWLSILIGMNPHINKSMNLSDMIGSQFDWPLFTFEPLHTFASLFPNFIIILQIFNDNLFAIVVYQCSTITIIHPTMKRTLDTFFIDNLAADS